MQMSALPQPIRMGYTDHGSLWPQGVGELEGGGGGGRIHPSIALIRAGTFYAGQVAFSTS